MWGSASISQSPSSSFGDGGQECAAGHGRPWLDTKRRGDWEEMRTENMNHRKSPVETAGAWNKPVTSECKSVPGEPIRCESSLA